MAKAISTKLASLLAEGSVKQKAVLYCMEYSNNKLTGAGDGLTDREAESLKKSLKTPAEAREWNMWIESFNFYVQYAALLGMTWEGFRGAANKLIGYLDLLNTYIQEENNLNTIYENVKGCGKKAEEAFARGLELYSLPFGIKAWITEDNYIEVDKEKALRNVKDYVDGTFQTYAQMAKASVIVVEDYARKTNSSSFMYPMMKKVIAAIKDSEVDQDYPKYSKKRLREKEAKGLRITQEERDKAIVPAYEDIEVDKAILDNYREKARSMGARQI